MRVILWFSIHFGLNLFVLLFCAQIGFQLFYFMPWNTAALGVCEFMWFSCNLHRLDNFEKIETRQQVEEVDWVDWHTECPHASVPKHVLASGFGVAHQKCGAIYLVYVNYLRVIWWCRTTGPIVRSVDWKMSRFQDMGQSNQNRDRICKSQEKKNKPRR